MPTTGDVLLLGKLGRAVGHSSNYTTETRLALHGRGSTGILTKMSQFDAGNVTAMTLSPNSGNSGTTTGTMTFLGNGSLFISRIGGRHENFTWTESSDDHNLLIIGSNGDYTSTITIEPGAPELDTITITGKFHEAGFSDGFNDHVTGYNTNKSDNFNYGDAG